MDTNNENKTTQAAGWVSNLLTGWGIPGTIARIIAGAIIGAICAAYSLTGTGCTAAYSQRVTADGITETTYNGELTPVPLDVLKKVEPDTK